MMQIVKYLRILLSALKADILDGRIRQIIFLGIANMLPDLYFFGYLRPALWRAAGVKIKVFGYSFIRKDVWIDFPALLHVGHHFHANRGTIISAHSGVYIGNHVTLSFLVGIHSLSHSGNNHEIIKLAPIYIGDNTIIYSHAVILPGVKLGNNVIIGSSVNVHISIDDDCKVVANCGKIISKHI